MTGGTTTEDAPSDEPGIVRSTEELSLCSHCGFPLPKGGSGLRHYGTHTAHQESTCLRMLHAEIERLKAALSAKEESERAQVA